MTPRIRFLFLSSILITCILLLTACDSNEKQIENDSDTQANQTTGDSASVVMDGEVLYEDWLETTYENITIKYPPYHRHIDEVAEMASGYAAAIERDSKFLDINPPTNKLTVLFYSSYAQGKYATGEIYPQVSGDTIHFWYPNFHGPAIVEYLLPRWYEGETRFPFLEHGLKALLDLSNNNYHQIAWEFIHDTIYADTGYIPLSELAIDTLTDVYQDRHQSALGASFVDYVIYVGGIERFKRLYAAQGTFDLALQDALGAPLDEVEVSWLRFIEKVAAASTFKKPENFKKVKGSNDE